MTRLAAKRLSAVEVSADASHQHEFHAGALRKLLGFPEQRTSGELAIIYHSADGSEPDAESCGFTLYDSREGQPRSAEYRLYFDSPELQRRAGSGDILVLSRPSDSDSLRALIIPAESAFGQELGRALDEEGIELTERFRDLAGTFGRASAAALLDAAAQPNSVVDPEDFLAVADGGFIGSALREGRLPGTREMAMEAGRIVGRLRRDRSNPDFDLKWSLDAETVLWSGLGDPARQFGVRRAFLDAFIGVAASDTGRSRMIQILSADSVAGEPLRDPTRWAIVDRLLVLGDGRAERLFAMQVARDTTPDGRRRAFTAGAARNLAVAKADYFNRFFADRSLNEDWASGSLGGFNAIEHHDLTLPYLRPALDSLPFIQQNRRIFFLGSWLGAFLGGQRSADALAIVREWLASHPELPADLRQKVLQGADELERTVRIRRPLPVSP